MHIKAYPGDADITVNGCEHKLRGAFDVFLNRERVTRCVEADDQRGFVCRYQTDDRDHICRDATGAPIIMRLYGTVEIHARQSQD